MYQTFLMYYPKTPDVNQCGSNFPQKAMLNFMGIEEVSKYTTFLLSIFSELPMIIQLLFNLFTASKT